MIERTKPISDTSIAEAISLKCASCYGALLLCHAFSPFTSDQDDDKWWLARTFSLTQLLDEADRRSIDLASVRSDVDDEPISECMRYKFARRLISEREFNSWLNDLRAGRI